MGSSGLFSKETKTNETNFLQREEALLLQARAAYVRRTTELFPIRRQVEQIEARRQLVRPSAQGLRLQQNETRQTADASILMQCIFVSQALWRREGLLSRGRSAVRKQAVSMWPEAAAAHSPCSRSLFVLQNGSGVKW